MGTGFAEPFSVEPKGPAQHVLQSKSRHHVDAFAHFDPGLVPVRKWCVVQVVRVGQESQWTGTSIPIMSTRNECPIQMVMQLVPGGPCVHRQDPAQPSVVYRVS